MQRNTGYFPTESLEPSGNRLFSRSALNEGDLFRGSLGTYASVEEAAEARKKAEEAIHGEVIGFYEKWSEKAAADPVWAKDNPIKISVSKSADAELRVQLQPDL